MDFSSFVTGIRALEATGFLLDRDDLVMKTIIRTRSQNGGNELTMRICKENSGKITATATLKFHSNCGVSIIMRKSERKLKFKLTFQTNAEGLPSLSKKPSIGQKALRASVFVMVFMRVRLVSFSGSLWCNQHRV